MKAPKAIKTMGIKPQQQKTPKDDSARKSVKAFVTKLSFNKLLAEGKSPEDAARLCGYNLPPGRRLSVSELSDLKSKGEVTKKRRGI